MYIEQQIQTLSTTMERITAVLDSISQQLRQLNLAVENTRPRQREQMTTAEVAEYLGVTRGHVLKLANQGAIPYHKTTGGKANIYLRSEIDAARAKTSSSHLSQSQLNDIADDYCNRHPYNL